MRSSREEEMFLETQGLALAVNIALTFAMAVGFLHPMVKGWGVRHPWISIPSSLPPVEGASPPEEISFYRKRGDTGS